MLSVPHAARLRWLPFLFLFVQLASTHRTSVPRGCATDPSGDRVVRHWHMPLALVSSASDPDSVLAIVLSLLCTATRTGGPTSPLARVDISVQMFSVVRTRTQVLATWLHSRRVSAFVSCFKFVPYFHCFFVSIFSLDIPNRRPFALALLHCV